MKKRFTFVLALLAVAFVSEAQNQITTPTGQPLVIGNQGVKMANLNSGSTTGASNGKVLTVDATGLIFLAPDAGGTGGGSSPWTTSGSNISFTAGNVGIGTTSPVQRLDVNGDINVPSTNGFRINNQRILSVPSLNSFAIGNGAGISATAASEDNIMMGFNAGANSNAPFNVFVGTRAGQNTTTGQYNIFIGRDAGVTNTTGTRNFLMGVNSGVLSNGSDNMFLGYYAGSKNTTGSSNFFAGVNSAFSSTTGSFNMILGRDAGYDNTSGNNNSFIGYSSGVGVVSGSNNTLVGSLTKAIGAGAASITNATAIGANAEVSASNSLVLGGTGANQVNVGIGNTGPAARLHVTAGGSTATGVRLENLPTSTGTVFPLVVDGSGNVMRSTTPGAREAAESLDRHWTLTADNHLVNNNLGGIMIGTGLSITPEGYKLYVSDGILTERVKVAVKSTADWRDNVLQDDYKLRTVEEVESFIKENKHLPGVPSAQEMVENGNDLQKTDAVLLEKIEEMMLYIIELKK
ncbi:hypothetical protein, partial [Persicitalea sp.]|uniref:hypothetical protein n=1 Tax=Persicitalea sp. TaxID=3100273 RepID=UPI0035937163